MTPEKLVEITEFAGRLKQNTRHCYTSDGRAESVADHCWRLALMAMLTEDEFPQADTGKIIKMCLIHDLGEAITGDIPCFDKSETDEETEKQLLLGKIKSFPAPYCDTLPALLEEMDRCETAEAKIYKALDKLEAVIAHNESDISTWLPREYTLQLTYGSENVEFSDYMKALKAKINADTREKIEKAGTEKILPE